MLIAELGLLMDFIINKKKESYRMFSLLCLSGSQQFSVYSGFGDSFEWAGPFDDTVKRYERAQYASQILNAFGFLTN